MNMVTWMITGHVLRRGLIKNVIPTVANHFTPLAAAIVKNPGSIKRLCHHETNGLQISTANEAGSLEIRKYLTAIGVDCSSLAKHADCYRTVLNKDKSTLQTLIHALEHHYSKNNINNLIYKVPQVLTLDAEELLMRIEFFESIGFLPLEILTSEYRSLVFTDYFFVTKSIIRVMHELLDASDNWIRSLMKFKSVVFKELKAEDVHATILLLQNLLLQHGCSDDDVKKVVLQVIRSDYRLLRTDKSNIVAVEEFFADKGFSGKDFISVFKKSPNIFQLTPEQLEQRLQYLKIVLEMSEMDVKRLVVRYPRALGMKKDNFDQHIDCFAEMGIDVSYIRTNPFVLYVSVDEIKRRFFEMEEAGIYSENMTTNEIRDCFYHLNSSKNVFEKDMDNYKESKVKNGSR